MTGYFRSLVSRAVPPGPRVRPMTVPYGLQDALPPQDLIADAALDTLDDADAREDDVQHEPTTATRTHDSKRTPGAPATTRDVTRVDAPRKPALPPRARRGTRLPSMGVTRPDIRVESTAALAREPDADRHASLPDARDPRTAHDERPRAERPLHVRPREAPRLTPGPSVPAADLPASDGAIARDSGHVAPDVHIHIGRIELTAVAAPAPSRRSSGPTPPAMPLDEYLRRRSRTPR